MKTFNLINKFQISKDLHDSLTCSSDSQYIKANTSSWRIGGLSLNVYIN